MGIGLGGAAFFTFGSDFDGDFKSAVVCLLGVKLDFYGVSNGRLKHWGTISDVGSLPSVMKLWLGVFNESGEV